MVPQASDTAKDEPDKKKQEQKKLAATLVPDLERCAFETDTGGSIKPISVVKTRLGHHAVGDLRVRIDKNAVSAHKSGARDEKPHWKAQLPTKVQLAWLAADAKIIYLAGFVGDDGKQVDKPGTPVKIHRLEVDSGKWLDDLVLEKPGAKEVEQPACVEWTGIVNWRRKIPTPGFDQIPPVTPSLWERRTPSA
jgi:hypothetical protein